MSDTKYSATGEIEIDVIPEKDFDRIVQGIKSAGTAYAENEFKKGNRFEVAVIGPQKLKAIDEAQLASVTLPLDWKIKQRKEMVRLGNELVQIGYYLGADPNLSRVLAAVIEGKTFNFSDEQQEK